MLLSKFTRTNQFKSNRFNQKKSKKKNFKEFRSREPGQNLYGPVYKTLGVFVLFTGCVLSLSHVDRIDDDQKFINQHAKLHLFGYTRPSQNKDNTCELNLVITSVPVNHDKQIKISLNKNNPSFDSKIVIKGTLKSDSKLQELELSKKNRRCITSSGIWGNI